MTHVISILLFWAAMGQSIDEKSLLEQYLSQCVNLESTVSITDLIIKHGYDSQLPIRPPIYNQYRISSPYGWRIHPITKKSQFHSGMDLSAQLASTIHATADGKVIFVGRKGGYGKCVIIEHKFGFATTYGHLSAYYVLEGDHVHAGKVIGFVGSSGVSTGNHLHYEVRKEKVSIKPFIMK